MFFSANLALMRWSSVTTLAAAPSSCQQTRQCPPPVPSKRRARAAGAVPGPGSQSCPESWQSSVSARPVLSSAWPCWEWGWPPVGSFHAGREASDGDGCKPVTYIASPQSHLRPHRFSLATDSYLFQIVTGFCQQTAHS